MKTTKNQYEQPKIIIEEYELENLASSADPANPANPLNDDNQKWTDLSDHNRGGGNDKW